MEKEKVADRIGDRTHETVALPTDLPRPDGSRSWVIEIVVSGK